MIEMDDRAAQLIDQLELVVHPEGGYFKEVYRSTVNLASPRTGSVRQAVTDIYFLLTAGQASRWHGVLHDEIYHFYEGAPLQLVTLDPTCRSLQRIMLGGTTVPPCYKHTVVGGHWQAAWSTGAYSLIGCTVAPGFDFTDFSFLADKRELRDRLQRRHADLYHLL